MKKMISNFADFLLSREDLKRVKGGYGTCGPGERSWYNVVHYYDENQSYIGSTSGSFCAPTQSSCESWSRRPYLSNYNYVYASCC